MATTVYPLDNQHSTAAAHHRAMAALFDPFTQYRIQDLPTWARTRRCLEVGAGHGSIAYWLAERTEQVVALDLKPDRIPEHPRLATVAHDLAADTDLAAVVGRPFDLVHARLTLSHLANRRTVLHRLAGLLAPGGMLLVEDWAVRWDAALDEVVVDAPGQDAANLYHRYHLASGRVFRPGRDPGWAPRGVPFAMAEEGLVDVATVVHGELWCGAGPGLRMLAAVAPQIRTQLLDPDVGGLTEPELDAVLELMRDRRLLVHPHLLYSTAGLQVPGGAQIV